MDADEHGETVTGVLNVFRRAWQEAAAIISATSDPDEAFRAAVEADKQLLALHNEQATRIKARQAVRIRQAHGLSLAKLAGRVNRSKALVAQYVQIDRQAEEAPCHDP